MLQFSTVLHLCAESELAARGDNTSGWDAPKRVAGLEVSERSTGRTISCQALIADYEGGRYLVSMLGEQGNWVRSVRAANGQTVVCHGARKNPKPRRNRARVVKEALAKSGAYDD